MLKNKEEETIFMKKKFVIYFCILALLILGVIFASSQVQALSRQEGVSRNEGFREDEKNNRINSQICRNEQGKMIECDLCEQNEECINRHNQCLTKTHNCRRNYSR